MAQFDYTKDGRFDLGPREFMSPVMRLLPGVYTGRGLFISPLAMCVQTMLMGTCIPHGMWTVFSKKLIRSIPLPLDRYGPNPCLVKDNMSSYFVSIPSILD